MQRAVWKFCTIAVAKAFGYKDLDFVDALSEVPLDFFEQRKVRKNLESVVDSLAERLSGYIETEFRGMPDHERERVIEIARDVIERTDVTIAWAVDLIAHPANVDQWVQTAVERFRDLSSDERILLGQLLTHAVVATARIAAQIPRGTEEFLRVLQADVLLFVKRIESAAGELAAKLERPTTEAHKFEMEYRRRVKYQLSYIPAYGLPRSIRNRHPVDLAYVPQSIEVLRGSAGRGSPEVSAPEHFLARSPRSALVANAGSGKSTLLRWIAVKCADRSLPAPLDSWNELVPIYVELKTFSQEGPPKPVDLIAQFTRNLSGSMPDGWLNSVLKDGRAVLLLDGIDEVPESQRETFTEWIEDFIQDFPEVRYVVTFRPLARPRSGGWFESFTSAELGDFSPADVSRFITRWHSTLLTQDYLQDIEIVRSDERTLRAELQRNVNAQRLARSPLLCALLCALNHSKAGGVPSSLGGLYKEVVSLLLEGRERDATVHTRPVWDALHLNQRRLIAQQVAYWLHTNNRTELDREELQKVVGRSAWTSADRANPEAIRQVAEGLLERSGLFMETSFGSFAFVHRTFQEYLAGCHLAEEHTPARIVQEAKRGAPDELVVFAFGRLRRKQQEDVLRSLLTLAEQRRLGRIALRCLEALNGGVPSTLRAQAEKAVDAHLRSARKHDVRTLVAAGQLSVRSLGKRRRDGGKAWQERSATAIRVLSQIGGPRALSELSAIARGDTSHDETVELLKAWRYFDTNDYYDKVVRPLDLKRWVIKLEDPAVAAYGTELSASNFVELRVDGQVSDLSWLPTSTRLAHLSLAGCTDLRDITGLSRVHGLRSLSLAGTSVESVEALADLAELEQLDLRGCRHIESLSPLTSMPCLKSLWLDGVRATSLRDGLPTASLEALSVSDCPELRDVSALFQVGSMRSLVARRSIANSWAGVEALADLEHLDLAGAANHFEVVRAAGCTRLRSLRLSHVPIGRSLCGVGALKHLELLDVSGSPHLVDLADLGGCLRLKSLYLADCEHVTDVSALATCQRLEELNLAGTGVTDVSPLAGLAKLRSVVLVDAPIKDFSPLRAAESLRVVFVDNQHWEATEPLRRERPDVEVLPASAHALRVVRRQSEDQLVPSA
jgi:Leucine-rich repeat (LRR) protein